MQRKVDDGLNAFGVGLDNFPRLGVGQILVSDACQVHGFFLCIAEAEFLDEFFHLFLHTAEFADGLQIVFGQCSGCGHNAVVVFLGELEGTVHEVSVNGHQFVVVAGLEVAPCEVVVLCLGSIGGEHIAQHILFAGHVDKVFVQPNGPVARGGNFVVLKIEELVGGHIVGQDV